MTGISADAFGPDAVSEEVARFNVASAARLAGAPDLFEVGVDGARDGGFMPKPPPSPHSYDVSIGGGVSLHVVPAENPRGVLLHIHGGGFMLGSASSQDAWLEQIADAAQVTCVSVEYRLAPEHPYPAAWDDCEAAAIWLTGHAVERFGAELLVIAGESAGALLSVATMLRLRERDLPLPFRGAALSFGVFDSTMTPSQTLAREGVLKASGIARIVENYAPDASLRRGSDLSPLYANLTGLPPALFTVGTLDAMLDDSMFLHCRWLAAGGDSEIEIYSGADHAFIETPHPLADAANARIRAFVTDTVAAATSLRR